MAYTDLEKGESGAKLKNGAGPCSHPQPVTVKVSLVLKERRDLFTQDIKKKEHDGAD